MKKIVEECKFTSEQRALVQSLAAACGISELTAGILYSRGIDTPEKAERFLSPSKKHFLSPFLMRGMQQLVAALTDAKGRGDTVVVRQGDSIDVCVVSDRLKNIRGRVSVETMLLSGGRVSVFEKDIAATANASTKALSIPVGEMLGGCPEGNVVIVLKFTPADAVRDGLANEYVNHFFLPKQKDMNYPECNISFDVREADGVCEVSVSSDRFARGVYLYADGIDLHFSDNFFDLLPGETRTVTVRTDAAPEILKQRLKTMSLSDTY